MLLELLSAQKKAALLLPLEDGRLVLCYAVMETRKAVPGIFNRLVKVGKVMPHAQS